MSKVIWHKAASPPLKKSLCSSVGLDRLDPYLHGSLGMNESALS